MLGLLSAVAWVRFGSYPVHDTYFHLVWGRELLDGSSPTFEAYGAPTPHPLLLAMGAVLAVLPDGDRLFVAVSLFSFIALLIGVYRLGSTVFGRWSGLAAAALVAGSLGFITNALLANKDVLFLALIVWAAAIEARSPRRGLPVLVTLCVAGLLRPEAWLLAGAYWLWCLPRWDLRQRVATAALVAAPAVLWMLIDLLVTGNAFHSLTYTSAFAEELGRERGVAAVPRVFASAIVDIVNPAVVPLGIAGAILAWRWTERRNLFVPAALFGVGVLTFLAIGVAGLSLIPRYVALPGIALCVFGGYALMGFTDMPRGDRRRKPWTVATAVLVVGGLGLLVVQSSRFERVFREAQFNGDTHVELARILEDPEVQRAASCGPLTFPGYRLVPDASWLLDEPVSSVRARSERTYPGGVSIALIGEDALEHWGRVGHARAATNTPGSGFTKVAQSEHFAAYVSCP